MTDDDWRKAIRWAERMNAAWEAAHWTIKALVWLAVALLAIHMWRLAG